MDREIEAAIAKLGDKPIALNARKLAELATTIGRHNAKAILQATAPLVARIGQLESEVAVLKALADSKLEEPR